MATKVRQFIVYSKVTFIGLIFIGVTLILFKNRNYKTNFWPGADGEQVSTLWLMLATAITSILVFWIFSKTLRVIREVQQVRAEQALQERLADQDRFKENLDAQERRIDEKIKRAIAEDGPTKS